MKPYTLPADTQVQDAGNPAADMNAVLDAITVLGAAASPYSRGADDTGTMTSSDALQVSWGASPVLRLPAGTFKLTTLLYPPAPVSVLEGSGWNTVLLIDGAQVPVGIGMADTTQRTVIIRNLRIAQANSSAPGGTAILADYFTSQSVIEGVRIDGVTKHWNIGVDYGLASTNTHYCLLADSRIQVDGTNAVGVRYGGGATGAMSNVFRNNRVLISATDATQTGIVVNTPAIELDHPDIESGAGIGIDVQAGGHACTIIAPYLESNGINLRLASGVIAPTVLGGTILTGATADVQDNGAVAPKILGVRGATGVACDAATFQASAAAGKIVYVVQTNTSPSDAALRVDAPNGQQAVAVRNTGDGAARWRVTSTGSHDFGNGTAAPDCHHNRAGANLMQYTNCDLSLATEGYGLRVKEGVTSGRMGTAVLSGGTVTVACTAVTAATRIFLTRQVAGGTTGQLQVGGRTPGTSFTITSSSGADTSTVAYLLVEPG